MRAILQRVRRSSVTVKGVVVGEIGQGLTILVGVGPQDTPQSAGTLADKAARLRIFEDDQGKMNLSLLDIGGQALVISQFTLYADTRRGRRPSFTTAAAPQLAEPLVGHFCEALRGMGVPVEQGSFGAEMLVEIENDGPVTIVLSDDAWES